MGLKHRGIIRLGYVRIGLNDRALMRARGFYRGNLGMLESIVDSERTYFRCWHEAYQHSLVIDETAQNRLIEIGFQVRDQADIAEFTKKLRAAGVKVKASSAGKPLKGLGKSISFEIPGGQTIRLFEHMEQIGYATGFDSPDWVVPRELRATPAPLFLNHVGITVPNPKQTVDFLTRHLDFYVSEKIVSDNGRKLLSALLFRMTKDVGGQELAIYPGEAGRLHQIAFTKEDANDILIDGQYLRNDRIDIDEYGPTRQSYGKTFSLHFYDPFGVRLELCSGGRITDPHPDFEPVIWTESNLKKALSYYDRDLNPRFLEPCL